MTTPNFDLDAILKKALTGNGGSRAISVNASPSVNVNPVISNVVGPGSPYLASSGSATANPNTSATAQPRPVYRAAYGLGSGVLPLDSGGDLPPEIGGSNAQGVSDPDFMTLALLAGGGLALWYVMGS